MAKAFVHISLSLANTPSSIKHLCATAEENSRGFRHHDFPSLSSVCLLLPPEVADSLSLCLEVKTHGWRQTRPPNTSGIPMGKCNSQSVTMRVLMQELLWVVPLQTTCLLGRVELFTQLQNLTKSFYTWKSVTEQLGESSAINSFCIIPEPKLKHSAVWVYQCWRQGLPCSSSKSGGNALIVLTQALSSARHG